MPNATVRANARTLSIRRPRIAMSLRRRLESTLENLIGLLDELDGDPDLEDGHDREDDPAESGIGDDDGRIEQLVGEPSLGATQEIDQRIAWSATAGWFDDGEATGTVEDIEVHKSREAWEADRQASAAVRDQVRKIAMRRSARAIIAEA